MTKKEMLRDLVDNSVRNYLAMSILNPNDDSLIFDEIQQLIENIKYDIELSEKQKISRMKKIEKEFNYRIEEIKRSYNLVINTKLDLRLEQ